MQGVFYTDIIIPFLKMSDSFYAFKRKGQKLRGQEKHPSSNFMYKSDLQWYGNIDIYVS